MPLPNIAKTYAAGQPQVVWTTLIADLETPVSAMLKLTDGQKNVFLLESVEGGNVRGRFSILGMKPDLIWRFSRDQAEINRKARVNLDAFEPCTQPPLQALRALVEECKIDLPDNLPPMAAGLFGYMGYDAVRLSEAIPDTNPDDLGVPDGMVIRPTVICVFDRLEDMVTVISPARPRDGISAEAAYEDALGRLADLVADFERGLPQRRDSANATTQLPEATSNTTPEEYMAMVKKAKGSPGDL